MAQGLDNIPILGPALSGIGSALGFGGQDGSLQPVVSPLDQGTSDLVDKKNAQGNLTDQDLATGAMNGVDSSRGFLATPERLQQTNNALGGPVDNGMSAALAAKSNRYFDAKTTDLGRQAQFAAPGRRAANMTNAQSALGSRQQVANQVQQRIYNAQYNQQQVRNQVLNGLFSGLGSIGGAMLGGPAGAAVGSKVGGSVAPAPTYKNAGDFNQ